MSPCVKAFWKFACLEWPNTTSREKDISNGVRKDTVTEPHSGNGVIKSHHSVIWSSVLCYAVLILATTAFRTIANRSRSGRHGKTIKSNMHRKRRNEKKSKSVGQRHQSRVVWSQSPASHLAKNSKNQHFKRNTFKQTDVEANKLYIYDILLYIF